MIAKVSPHRIIETARDGVSVIAEHEFDTAEAARDAFQMLVTLWSKHGLYAQLYTDGESRLSVSAPAETE